MRSQSAFEMEDGLPMLENRESCRLRKVPVTLEPCKQRRNHWKARNNYLYECSQFSSKAVLGLRSTWPCCKSGPTAFLVLQRDAPEEGHHDQHKSCNSALLQSRGLRVVYWCTRECCRVRRRSSFLVQCTPPGAESGQ